jgi:hypothetical protein
MAMGFIAKPKPASRETQHDREPETRIRRARLRCG